MGNVRPPFNTFSLDDLVSDISADIDTEIDTRTRLAETLEARIAWAIILKESAEGRATGNASQATFKNVACETLVENEENSRFLFTSGPTPPPIPPVSQQVSRVQKKIAPFPTKQKASFLYIRSTALNHSTNDLNHLYLLKCPACGRTTFTSLQGLLNHARLSHNLEWGTHDECIRACAVPDNDMDITQGAEVGLGPSGVLAGLRTIFERAVGTSKHNINFQAEPAELQTEDSQKSATTQTQLNLTLGFHEESPALAPFLGKTAIRRQISVYDEDVDITSTQPEANRKLRWKMPFAHRSFREDLTKSLDGPSGHTINLAENDDIEGNDTIATQGTLANQHSRFHFIARIVVADRSMWAAPEHRSPEASSHTHKWMISIDAPSYAFHITSILKCVQVTPQTEDITSVSSPPPTNQPPFIVLGTSNAPFLAKITLTFTGTNRDGPTKTEQKVTLEHWVDLDPLRSELVTVGQEQILDVELDKNTQLGPIYTGYLPINSKAHWSLLSTDAPQQSKMKRVDGHHQILVKLAKQYPLFVKTAEKPPPGVNPPYSYLLPTSSLQWNEFCAGRRKAIAWGRSQAICEAYKSIRQSSRDNMQHLVELKTGDVYHWLLGNGMFPATPGEQMSLDSSNVFQQETLNLSNMLSRTTEQWCTICGLLIGGSDPPEPQHCCAAINTPRVFGLSRVDVRKSLWEQKSQLHPPRYDNSHPGQSSLAVHPSFLRWVKDVAESTRSSDLSTSHPETPFYLDELGGNLRDVERSLAPFKVLSIAVQSLVRRIVESGVRVIEEERKGATPTPKYPKLDKAGAEITSRKRLLTPSHILSGLLSYDRGGGDEDFTSLTVKLSLSKLGVPVLPSQYHGSGGHQTAVQVEWKDEERPRDSTVFEVLQGPEQNSEA